ncbi:MAG: SDR family NAD(P)-dependent oxidoreductase [Candidatus Omnitrophica bacterium]|nr:SDR family NAD(P)-dependent oxidoreductase [Candidatus Omnitrophota bacterium]
MKRFQTKVAVITGGSRGIGRAIAEQFAREGAAIVLNYLRNEEAARETEKILKGHGARVLTVQANVGNPKEAESLIEAAGREFGKIHILVHNAALGAFKPVEKLRVNQWDLSLDVNAKALLVLTQTALPFLEKDGGSVIALSSLGSKRYIPNSQAAPRPDESENRKTWQRSSPFSPAKRPAGFTARPSRPTAAFL